MNYLKSIKIRGFSSCLFLTLISLLITVSCSTLSPVTSLREVPKRAAGIDAVRVDWQPFAIRETSGLAYFAGKIQKPQLEFWALKIDLTAPELRIVVGGGNSGDPLGTSNSTWVSGFVRRNDLLAGINTNPFDPVSGKEGEKRTIIGIAVSEGRLLAPPNSRFDALVFYTNGKAAILSQAELFSLGDMESIYNAVGGFNIVLQEGKIPRRLLADKTPGQDMPKQDMPRHPRSAAGLSADGKTLYLLAIDGRRFGSIGATEAEIGLLLKQLGASEGLNFDGGGSTSLALRYPDGKVRPVNIPIHRQIPGNERGVAVCLGISLF
ncbi:hypothetical protein FACS189450_11530 [Spirochaetia bacterium]|nr:hypothetical protein FACS189450_11530 [Spirochaetia bacterium]